MNVSHVVKLQLAVTLNQKGKVEVRPQIKIMKSQKLQINKSLLPAEVLITGLFVSWMKTFRRSVALANTVQIRRAV